MTNFIQESHPLNDSLKRWNKSAYDYGVSGYTDEFMI